MYCVKCGVKLSDSEKKCPLCNTVVYHPDVKQEEVKPLYPYKKMPINSYSRKVLCGMIIILFLIPLVISFYSDFYPDNKIDWFGFVNPVIFVPCSLASIILYLFYVCLKTHGNWFLTFALPVWGGLSLIICAIVTLLHYLKRGRLYIFGGAMMLFGGLMWLIEFLLDITFNVKFIGWSIYPFIILFLLGGALIYLAINSSVRRMIERKLFF